MRWQWFIIFLLWFMFALLLIRIHLQQNLDSQNQTYQEIEDQIAKVKLENETLTDEILLESSLTTIYQKAKAMGFVPANYVFLQ